MLEDDFHTLAEETGRRILKNYVYSRIVNPHPFMQTQTSLPSRHGANRNFSTFATFFLGITMIGLIFSCKSTTDSSASTESPLMRMANSDIAAPAATKKPKELTIHGDTRMDPYYWLNERENPEVIDYLTAENQYRDTMMAHSNSFKEKLYNELIGRVKQTDMSVPFRDNGYFYITRYEEGQEYAIHSRKKENLEAAEEIMLDVNQLAKGFDYYAVGSRSVSPDNRLLAYGEDTLSRRIYTLRFKDLTTGNMLPDIIPNTGGGATWAADNKTIFYATKDSTLRNYRIWKHKLGTPASKDVLVYEEKDETFGTSVYKTKSKKYIVIGCFSTLSQEYRILDASNPDGEWKIFQARKRGLEYNIEHFNDIWYVRTNKDAQNFRLMKTPVGSTGEENWKEVIPNRKDVLLEGMEVFKDYLVLSERKAGITQIRIIPSGGS